MARPTSIDVGAVASHELEYDLDTSPPASLYTIYDAKPSRNSFPDVSSKRLSIHTDITPVSPPTPTPKPSIRLLFSLLTPRQRLIMLIPAIVSSIIAGGVAPFMTLVVGQVFNNFAEFPLTPDPPQEAKDKLIKEVGINALQLLALAIGSIALSSLTSSLWILTGENNTMSLRKQVYASVAYKEMPWFDTKMSGEDSAQSVEDESGPVGAGGLMARFTRETDEVRKASSLASGMLLQYFVTTVTCLALGFSRSWALTLVILASVPLLMIIQGVSQVLANPLLATERAQTAASGTLIDRALSAISTVKAFNAENHEHDALSATLDKMAIADRKVTGVWGLTTCFSHFTMMAMFVQAFWFGGKLVRDGTVAPGDVMAVFWACLIATSNLQLCIPQFITISKGKFAMVSLLSLVDTNAPETPHTPSTPSTRSLNHSRGGQLRKITPSRCVGEFALHDVSFAYPSRPSVPVLRDVSLYLPANETTFIVGGSGSGKSTIAQLLLRMYKPQSGSIQLDDQDLTYLDENWTREHIAGVSQGCILFDMSVHDNVAMGLAGFKEGRSPSDATRDEVVDACTAALMHEFVRDLPDGYDTQLGNGGANLSGGQKQRLAIARAKLRDPTVLILDEATSALDPTSRILVFEAIKHCRANKTTIVITHDLSQITSKDFVYVLKEGSIVEQGYRYDLETTSDGEFRHLMDTQGATGGFLPAKEVDEQHATENIEEILDVDADLQKEKEEDLGLPDTRPFSLSPDVRHLSRRVTLGNWMFDVISDLTSKNASTLPTNTVNQVPSLPSAKGDVPDVALRPRQRRPSSVHIVPALPAPEKVYSVHSRRSLQFTPTSATFSFHALPSTTSSVQYPLDPTYEDPEKQAVENSGTHATSRRRIQHQRTRWDETKLAELRNIKVDKAGNDEKSDLPPPLALKQLLKDIYPTVPHKPLIAFGLILCIMSGSMTPIFSFVLSRLLYEVSIGADNVAIINKFGGIVLSVAALDGILLGAKYFLMDICGMMWITRVRKLSFRSILSQDKKWFDKTDNSPPRLVQIILKDGDDARNLIGTVIGQCVLVFTMLAVGLIWALARGWQLTLAGLAIAPIFAGTMAVQSRLVAKCEFRNKRAREEVAKSYYEAISNVRGIRSMALETIFQRQFDKAADKALSTGVQGAFVEGCTYGVSSGLIYFSEALLFYVSAVLVARGIYTYLEVVEVLNLVVFTVSIGSQLMAFTEKIHNAVQATRDLNGLLHLHSDTDESKGSLKPPIDGDITFRNVSFSYPERPDVPVLKNLDLHIHHGESVAIVGTSGSGKSTIAYLLQRLYEPERGSLIVGKNELRAMDVRHLRQHVSVVSQNPYLFDASIFDNITYGDKSISSVRVRQAAKQASAHDFVMSLPQGYDTLVGENASQISGGQAQRLSIARALARPSNIMILDECTSALDHVNQAAVIDAIQNAKAGRTVIMVTHKLPVMRLCDRIMVLDQGRVAEYGTYEELMERKGVFASLASGGEWAGE